MEKLDLFVLDDSKSPISEAYRTLRTNIQFSSLDKELKVILVTSSGPGEGKSTTSANLAVVMAQSGKKTLLIDCDLRKPKLHRFFEDSNKVGLTNYIIGQATFEEAIKKTMVENLYLLSSGKRPPNPSELLNSNKMKQFIAILKENFDYIILDTPPIIMVTDAQILAQYADGCILVVASAQAERDAAIRAKLLLEKGDTKIIGVVLNKLDITSKKYYGHYYQYYYGSDEGKKK